MKKQKMNKLLVVVALCMNILQSGFGQDTVNVKTIKNSDQYYYAITYNESDSIAKRVAKIELMEIVSYHIGDELVTESEVIVKNIKYLSKQISFPFEGYELMAYISKSDIHIKEKKKLQVSIVSSIDIVNDKIPPPAVKKVEQEDIKTKPIKEQIEAQPTIKPKEKKKHAMPVQKEKKDTSVAGKEENTVLTQMLQCSNDIELSDVVRNNGLFYRTKKDFINDATNSKYYLILLDKNSRTIKAFLDVPKEGKRTDLLNSSIRKYNYDKYDLLWIRKE